MINSKQRLKLRLCLCTPCMQKELTSVLSIPPRLIHWIPLTDTFLRTQDLCRITLKKSIMPSSPWLAHRFTHTHTDTFLRTLE